MHESDPSFTISTNPDAIEVDLAGNAWTYGVIQGNTVEFDNVPLPASEDQAEWELFADEALHSCGWLRISPFTHDIFGWTVAQVRRLIPKNSEGGK